MPGYGEDRGHFYARQVFDSTSKITPTVHQAISEGALLRPKFLPPWEVTLSIYHQLKTLADRRISKQKGTHVLIKTDLSHMRVRHETYAIG